MRVMRLDDETMIVRKVAVERPRKLPRQFAREQPVRWPIYILFALILFAFGVALALDPIDVGRRSRMSEHADELLKDMKR